MGCIITETGSNANLRGKLAQAEFPVHGFFEKC